MATVVGLVIGYSSLRLSRHAFAIVSLSFALLCMIVARDWVSLTRGAMGIPGLPVPTLALFGWAWRLSRPADFYYLLLGFAAAARSIQELFLAGRKEAAAAAVPDALIDACHLVGPADRIRDRAQRWISAGKRDQVGTMLLRSDQAKALEVLAETIL